MKTWHVWLGFTALWIAISWPGLREAWWFFDDFDKRPDAWQLFARGLRNGRPVEGLLFVSHAWDQLPDHRAANIALRLLQGMLHTATASIAACWLARFMRPLPAIVAVLPFLLWPFAAEATLWRTALSYPVAALLGMLAFRLAQGPAGWRRRGLAVLLGALAVLSNQNAALAGAVIALIVWLASVLGCDRDGVGDGASMSEQALRTGPSRLAAPALGLLLGAVISVALLHLVKGGVVERGSPVFQPLDKLRFLARLDSTLLAPPYLPGWLRVVQIALVVLGLACTVVAASRSGRRGPWAGLAALWLAVLVGRYGAVMLTAESWESWRVMYLAPLIFTCAWVAIEAVRLRRWQRFIARGAMAIMLLAYARVGWINSGEYPEIYRQDMRVASELREFCESEELRSVCMLTIPDHAMRSMNPYGFRYMHCESKLSVWLRNWFERIMVESIAGLELETDPAIEAEAAALWSGQEIGGFRLMRLPGRSVAFVCPP